MTATLELRQGLNSCGGLQWRILGNERKLDLEKFCGRLEGTVVKPATVKK